MTRIRNLHDFWPVYLAAHANARCRALHYCASLAGLLGIDAAFATGNARWAVAGIVTAYAFAWAGHLFVGKNVPLTFRYPLWSLLSDYRMFFAWLSGHLQPDLDRLARDATMARN